MKTIKNSKYVVNPHTGYKTINCIIGGVHCNVPMNIENADYQEILKWVAEGNTIEEAD